MPLDVERKRERRESQLLSIRKKPSSARLSTVVGSLARKVTEERSSRRGFSGFVATSGLAIQLGTLSTTKAAQADSSSPLEPPEMRVATVEEVESGAVVDFLYPAEHRAFVIALDQKVEGGVGPNENIVAYHRACPHMGCQLKKIDVVQGHLGPCPCHLSLFDLSNGGLQIHGMASQALVRVLLEARGDELFAVGILGLPYGDALSQNAIDQSLVEGT